MLICDRTSFYSKFVCYHKTKTPATWKCPAKLVNSCPAAYLETQLIRKGKKDEVDRIQWNRMLLLEPIREKRIYKDNASAIERKETV